MHSERWTDEWQTRPKDKASSAQGRREGPVGRAEGRPGPSDVMKGLCQEKNRPSEWGLKSSMSNCKSMEMRGSELAAARNKPSQ